MNIGQLEARQLMAADGRNVETAAFAVGYESASQFSREYHACSACRRTATR